MPYHVIPVPQLSNGSPLGSKPKSLLQTTQPFTIQASLLPLPHCLGCPPISVLQPDYQSPWMFVKQVKQVFA